MSLLGGICYDPTTAVAKATSALLAMTALDTTNLRISFTVPANGAVLVRLAGVINGGSAFPQVLLGVLEGSTVKGRVAANASAGGSAATAVFLTIEGIFVVSGLTPGANLTWDAAYGVETLAASSAIRYGGPNNTTGNDAYGGFCFEVWTTS